VVVDVGGGKACPFAHFRKEGSRTRIVAVDCSEEELRENEDVDEKVVADVTRGLPFPDASVDMVVSRSVLEHLRDVRSFVAEARRVLKEGGYFIHLFPCRFAPFAVINRALPHAVSRKILYSLVPETKGIGGFPAVYRDCYHSAMRRVLEDGGFEIEEMITSYYQSPYFSFFLPLYLLSAAYEALVRALGAKNLCAYLLVVAKKAG
jgi:ubiquinone/menaquinone biosynthesis C-methylase UbiE